MRFLIENEGKLYELVRSKVGCSACMFDPSNNLNDCSRKEECQTAAELLFGNLPKRHWEEIKMG